MSIGERLREERTRLELSQEKLGAIGGVQKRAQINYESGERQPDALYLRGVAQIGVDVQYVLLGVRSANLDQVMLSDEFVEETSQERVKAVSVLPTVELLGEDERALLALYRKASPERRDAAMGALLGFSAGTPSNQGAAAQHFAGANIKGGVSARDIVHKGERRKKE